MGGILETGIDRIIVAEKLPKDVLFFLKVIWSQGMRCFFLLYVLGAFIRDEGRTANIRGSIFTTDPLRIFSLVLIRFSCVNMTRKKRRKMVSYR